MSSSGISSATNTILMPTRSKVVTDSSEELRDRRGWVVTEGPQDLERVLPEFGVRGLEGHAEAVDRPAPNTVGGIVEHLPDYLAADPRIGRSLHLHQSGDRVLIDEGVIDAEP